MAIPVSAEIATVYRLLDGSLHHARCGRRLMVQGRSTEDCTATASRAPSRCGSRSAPSCARRPLTARSGLPRAEAANE